MGVFTDFSVSGLPCPFLVLLTTVCHLLPFSPCFLSLTAVQATSSPCPNPLDTCIEPGVNSQYLLPASQDGLGGSGQGSSAWSLNLRPPRPAPNPPPTDSPTSTVSRGSSAMCRRVALPALCGGCQPRRSGCVCSLGTAASPAM